MILTTYFNSRPSARGDALWQGGHAPSPISIHAPPRGATRELIKKYYTSKFQFTPLREGRLNVMLATIYNFISIHAPPRGATSSELRRVARSRNFNSRPSARGDFRVMPGGYTPGNFNSRPSARGDSDVAVFVNILSDFNSRPSARGDHQSIFVRTAAASFQFTPLREGRLPGVVEIQSLGISIHAPPRGATRSGRRR